MKKILAAMLGGVALAPAAFAQEADDRQFYGWLGYGTGEFDQAFAGDTARLGVVQGKFGWRPLRYLGVEVEGGVGVDKDEVFLGEVKVEREYGAYVVGFLPVLGTVDLFARAGYASVELESTTANAQDQDSSGAGYGGGAIWYVGPLDVRFEFTRYDVDNTADAYMISIGSRF